MLSQKVTIIIPVRITDEVYRAEERLRNLAAAIPRDKFEIIVSDYGTPAKYQPLLAELRQDGLEVVSLPGVEDHIFSPGRCRDYGVQHARTEVVMLNDLDFYANQVMYANIFTEIMNRDLAVNTYDFFCVPAFFLTENGTAHYLSRLDHSQGFNYYIHRKLYENQADFCLFPAYGSSAIVVNRRHYLALGGHNHEFFGHGAEDYDFLHRLGYYYCRAPKSADYYQDTKSNAINRFLGFRAYFALYGIDVFHRGLFVVHLWHPSRTMIDGYYQSRRNFALLEKTMRQFDRNRQQPAPLADLTKSGRQLILLKQRNSVLVKALRQVMGLLGSYEIIEEGFFNDGQALLNYLDDQKISGVGFLNPYGNEHRLGLYQTLKASGRDFWVFDRGALPDSWFFDRGFNYDSPSYRPPAWDQPLTKAGRAKVEQYLGKLRQGRATLEQNGPRQAVEKLRAKYQTGRRKVLFIPYQRPDDSVIAHFAGPVGDMAGFRHWTDYLARHLDPDKWLIVRKKHPLENQVPEAANTILAESDTHIHDLLELAEAVFLINSGVGVLGLAFGKPVICAGLAFYAHEGLAQSVANPEEALRAVTARVAPDPEKVNRFFHHLLERVYSFGAASYKKTESASGATLQVVSEITFRRINLLGKPYYFGRQSPCVDLNSSLFSSFGGPEGLRRPNGSGPKGRPNERPGSANGRAPARAQAKSKLIITFKIRLLIRKFIKLMKMPRRFFRDFAAKRRIAPGTGPFRKVRF